VRKRAVVLSRTLLYLSLIPLLDVLEKQYFVPASTYVEKGKRGT